MASRRRTLLGLGVAAVLVLVRAPLHVITHALPVSNDDAIPLLIARHILKGELATILWNQPYNGTLDAYLLAPGLLFASAHAVFRAYEAVGGVLLVVAVGLLAKRVGGETAGWAAAFLAAVGTPYMALMAATGPTPNFLVPLLVAVPVAFGLDGVDGRKRPRLAVAALGFVGGAAAWDSALALPALAGAFAGLVVAGLRPRLAGIVTFAAGFVLGASPLLVARLWTHRRTAGLLAAAVAVPWCVGHAVLVNAWRDPEHAVKVWQVPPLEPVLSTLERAGVRSVYASLQFAARLALGSDERAIASQAWNERIPGDPLRFKDEVDLD